MVLKGQLFLAFLITLMVVVQIRQGCDGFAFGSMGGGCGCGGCGSSCGGGCGGGCGRKKRSILQVQLRTEASFICPQTEWRRIIDESIQSNEESGSEAAEMALHSAMSREFEGTRLFVTCAEHTGDSPPSFVKFVTNGEAYCSHGNRRVWCTVAAMMA